MPPADASVSLHEIARVAGVSAMTVSRVMHNYPKVAQATRAKVLEAAQALNYQPDAHLTRMMHLVRGRKTSQVRAVIAVIRESSLQDELHDPAYQYVSIRDIQKRAEQHGYHAEEFWLGRDGMTPERLAKVLRARGIEGVIVSPQSSQMLCAQFDYASFSAATFGYGLREPSLHRSAGNMTLGIHRATAELTKRGYKRIGLAITHWVDARAESAYSGAMLHYQDGIPKRQRVPMLLFPNNDLRKGAEAFTAWMKQHKPDALISFDTHVPDWIKKLGLKVPDDLGLVVHDWTEAMKGMAGIHQRRDHVASAAVDLVATQLLHHERGVPEVPRQILIPSAWVDGPTIRPAPTLQQV
ncbi:MAG: LacI family DNA-binding transcriptional regulator [Verrucomicrobium sp.]